MEREELKKRKKKQLFLGTRVSPPHLFFVSRIFYGNSFLGATFLHNDVDDDSTSICVCTTDHSKVLCYVTSRAARNSNTRQVLTLKTQTRLNLSLEKPEKLVLFELKLEILE